jgi:hypothetical protein
MRDGLVKRSFKVLDGYVKKFDIQGVVFLTGTWLYMWYTKCLSKTYNAGDRTFYDAIMRASNSFRENVYTWVPLHSTAKEAQPLPSLPQVSRSLP